MKKISRMVIFSGLSIFSLTIFNPSFKVVGDVKNFIYLSILIAIIYYLLTPILKLILLPINILTLGFFSFIVYVFIFNFAIEYFHLATISSWDFPGLSTNIVIIPRLFINDFYNRIFCAFYVSFFISLLELLL